MKANYAMLADAAGVVALFKILFFVAFLAAWIGVRARFKNKMKSLTNPTDKAESLVLSASNSLQEELGKLRNDLAAKEERVRSGGSPLRLDIIEERKQALADLYRNSENANFGTLLERANKIQDTTSVYIRLAIDIDRDTLEELEIFLKTAETFQSQKGTNDTQASINDLRNHAGAARQGLEAARQTADSISASKLLASADRSLKAGLAIMNALRIVANI